MMEIFLKVLSGIAIAAVSSWITVQLSRYKFRSERWWEKKVEAYERVIEAFHNSKKFDSEHMTAEERGRDVDEARDAELRKLAKEARDEILKASDIGSFVLSENALKILARYEAESKNAPRQDTWYEHLDTAWSLTNSYMKEFIAEAHKDLKK
jgi:cell fate (sporulation/competence/biofilm development) regulator YlbF (YheA/YmcA/DUF963 family)